MIQKIFFAFLFMVSANVDAQKQALFVVAGQSNASGKGDSDLSVKPIPNTALEYRYRTNDLVALRDPVGADEMFFQAAATGSASPAFAKEYNALTGKKVIIVPAARGGSSCHFKAELQHDGTWDTGQMQLFDSAVIKIKGAVKKTGLPVDGIIWIQGERDANAILAQQLKPEEYKEALVNLINRFRKELGKSIEFYIVETGNYVDHPQQGFDAVREIQNQLSHELQNVYVVYKEAKDFASKGLMKDQIHYKQAAYNDIGTQVARWIVAHNRK